MSFLMNLHDFPTKIMVFPLDFPWFSHGFRAPTWPWSPAWPWQCRSSDAPRERAMVVLWTSNVVKNQSHIPFIDGTSGYIIYNDLQTSIFIS